MSRAPRASQRGSAMLLTLVIIAALLAGGAVLVGMQLSSNRATDITRSGLTALHCAEGGLAAARPVVAANYIDWVTWLPAGSGEPTWLQAPSPTAIDHDLDNDGLDDFVITLKDNDDELPPAPNNTTVDSDLRVFIVSTCIKFPDTPKQISDQQVPLVTFMLLLVLYALVTFERADL